MFKLYILISLVCSFAQAQYVKTVNGVEFEVSKLNSSEIYHAFNLLKNHPEIPHKVVQDGCSERAIKMCLILKENFNLTCGRIFAIGKLKAKTNYTYDGYVEWLNFHTAVFLIDKKNNYIVIDPSLFDFPVTESVWLNKLVELPGSKLKKHFYSTPYTYSPDSSGLMNFELASEDYHKMNEVLKRNKRIQNRHPLLQ